mmetsp:Transcript_28690/g.47041  ORF Transcript_28690/g.47041 Transcript_28690/m.47041 type:complete len:178 (-) Transcript_28690:61-594(-)|eukprot:CAMPEP_0202685348 /NCGR_PEP_ID=MMETSP1385-20130828/1083_1 /ASSEMBLY_ACC=CAM_ASM_000861 /TAXON_ID=933848 /ORGANISM="Elphidium margaritaceum" /LENGTH=177 /DNA_ID=CAMNT_0049339669 /DNA_START=50 /DNA_END=583 /DNA_ORIENTATION=+
MSSAAALTKKMETALLNQMRNEFRVSQFYLSASHFFLNRHFHGISQHLRKEYNSELNHAFEISDYMTKRESDLTTAVLDVQTEIFTDAKLHPKKEVLAWKKPLDVFTFIYNAEVQNQNDINELMTLSQTEQDHATYQFLLEFMKQQIECTHESEDLLAKVRAYSGFEGLLWHLDKML